MKLIFRYICREDWTPKGYIRVCKSFKRTNEIPKEIEYKELHDLILKKNILDEIFLANYLDTVDLDLAEYVLDKLKDKSIDDSDIGSQGWEAYIENDKVMITVMFSTEDDEKVYIDRKEVTYAMLKWKKFLERKFDSSNYQEIIDTEDVHK